MLTHLLIRNFILIDSLQLSFGHKLTVLTGETGAGKSILLDAVSFALGARADTAQVTNGSGATSVAATFELKKGHPALSLLVENGILDERSLAAGGEVIVRRTLDAAGKSRIFINDVPVSSALAKSAGDLLVEIHGQFDNLSLLNPATHMGILDAFGRLGPLVEKTRSAYALWQEKKAARMKAEEEFKKAKDDEDYLKHSLGELAKLDPKKGEEEELGAKRRLLMNSEKTITNIKDAGAWLAKYGGEPEKFIAEAARTLDRIPEDAKGDSVRAIVDGLHAAASGLADAYERISQILADGSFDAAALEETEERLFAIKELARKHRVAPDELPAFLGRLRQMVEGIDNSDALLSERKEEEDAARNAYLETARKLSSERRKHAAILGGKVLAELAPLKLDKATFEVEVGEADDEKSFSPSGINSVCFAGATNAGGKRGNLAKIASGGELARFTLAIKVVILDGNSASTMIFDEVDTGISGATAAAVGERLARLGAGIQTLVVTHSPQVASFGNHHLKVSKFYDEEKSRTVTTVDQLTEQQRVGEIARIISGDRITGEAIAAAGKLLATSSQAYGGKMRREFTSKINGDYGMTVLGVAEGGGLSSTAAKLDRVGAGIISRGIANSGFKGGLGETLCIHSQKVMLAGLGAEKDLDAEKLKRLGGAIGTAIEKERIKEAFLIIDGMGDSDYFHIAKGAVLKTYKFDKYVTKKKETPVVLLSIHSQNPQKSEKDFAPVRAEIDATVAVRDFANEPSNVLTVAAFADEVRKLKKLGLDVDIVDERRLRKMGANLILAVGSGSKFPPCIATVRYAGNKRSKSTDLALVGKGICFDSGGISIKPSAGMDLMKADMAGAAVVFAAMRMIAATRPAANVVGVLGLAENMPDGGAYKPGDIVKSLSGQTVEILNTDAEGRLVLADCITYAVRQFKPREIIDFATLTGAVIIALGEHKAGLFSNSDKLAGSIFKAGEASGDEVWRLPLG
ncbi:MAG: DNA repair protein RecN, partial [Rickettsiales bacterium]|nr:DNA repair protein RecN [Rickettsiales bacterium]